MFASTCTLLCTPQCTLPGTAVSIKETLRNIDVPLVSLLLTLKRFHNFSQYFIFELEEVFLAVFTSRD